MGWNNHKFQWLLSAAYLSFTLSLALGARAARPPLRRIAVYRMPAGVHGYFDHLTADPAGHRLFAAAESAHKVLIYDLRSGHYLGAISGISKPHAILVRTRLQRIFVTDGGAGEVRIYNAHNYHQMGAVRLKVDSDSIGYDPASHDLWVVNGGGDAHQKYSMLSVINTQDGKLAGQIRISGDTLEAMALDPNHPRLYQENPSRSEVDVINRRTRRVIARWPVTQGKKNVAIAFDPKTHRLFLGCRSGVIVVMDSRNGRQLQALQIAKGIDDLIFDSSTSRLYAPCGAGWLYVYREQSANHYQLLGKVRTPRRAKNATLAASLHRLYTTVPPRQGKPGEIYVFQIR